MLSNYSNGCSATYAIRPPPMSHTPSITIIFLECVRHPRSSRVSDPTLATNKPNCIAILSSKVNNFCSTQLPTVAWWLGLIRWTIWMIKTDLFQNLPSWRCLGLGTPPLPQQTHMQHPMWKVNIKISQTRAKRGTTSLETTLQKPSAENGYRNGFHTNLISFFLST